jgi:hypothetical protein
VEDDVPAASEDVKDTPYDEPARTSEDVADTPDDTSTTHKEV